MISRSNGILCLIFNTLAALIVLLTRFAPQSLIKWSIFMNSPDWAFVIGPKNYNYTDTISLVMAATVTLIFVVVFKQTNWSVSTQDLPNK